MISSDQEVLLYLGCKDRHCRRCGSSWLRIVALLHTHTHTLTLSQRYTLTQRYKLIRFCAFSLSNTKVGSCCRCQDASLELLQQQILLFFAGPCSAQYLFRAQIHMYVCMYLHTDIQYKEIKWEDTLLPWLWRSIAIRFLFILLLVSCCGVLAEKSLL